MKLPFYRLHTGMAKAQIFDPPSCPEYKEYLDKRNKLGATATGDPFIPEHFQTKEMLIESAVAVTDKFGTFDTPDKELAKLVLKMCHFQSGVFTADTPEVRSKKLMDLYSKVLDRSSPRDILKELDGELKRTLTVNEDSESSIMDLKAALLKEKAEAVAALEKSNKVKSI